RAQLRAYAVQQMGKLIRSWTIAELRKLRDFETEGDSCSASGEERGRSAACYKSDCTNSLLARLPLDEDALIVPKAATAGGFRTVRVGKRNSARNALAANRAAALWGIGLRGIGSSRPVAAVGLWNCRLPPQRPSPKTPRFHNSPSAPPQLTPFGARQPSLM